MTDTPLSTKPYLSLVIPVFNEQDNIEILYKEIKIVLNQMLKPYEIIFVDDHSTDATFERLLTIKRGKINTQNVIGTTRIIRFKRNFGQTAAMQAGFDFAEGEVIVSMDGDLQNDPRDLPFLLAKMEEGYDVVCGWRKNRKDKTLTRIIPSKIANWIIGKITGVYIHDNGCSLKAFKKRIIKSITLYSDMHRFIPAMATLAGARITEIVVNHRPRKFGTTKYGLSRTWKVMSDIITVKMLIHFSDKPIVWFASFGLFFGLLGVAMILLTFLTMLHKANSTVYIAAGILFFTLCSNLISWGLLAEFFTQIPTRRKGYETEKE
jgi:glycosyltransferase involved in cell wall biosynthesis